MKPPINSSVALTACGTAAFSATWRACLGASTDCGPISSADRPPARWLEATWASGWPTTFRSSAFRPGAISAAGRLTSCGWLQFCVIGSLICPPLWISWPFR